MEFVDPNFKLSVISVLLDQGYFVQEVKQLKDQHADYDDYSYLPIPAIYNFYLNLELTPELLDTVDELQPDADDWVYFYCMNIWDGEDDQFYITSLADAPKLRNLRRFDPIALVAEDLDYAPLLQCHHLEYVDFDYMAATSENEAVRATLLARGVEGNV